MSHYSLFLLQFCSFHFNQLLVFFSYSLKLILLFTLFLLCFFPLSLTLSILFSSIFSPSIFHFLFSLSLSIFIPHTYFYFAFLSLSLSHSSISLSLLKIQISFLYYICSVFLFVISRFRKFPSDVQNIFFFQSYFSSFEEASEPVYLKYRRKQTVSLFDFEFYYLTSDYFISSNTGKKVLRFYSNFFVSFFSVFLTFQ
jgi:hypothetical protein